MKDFQSDFFLIGESTAADINTSAYDEASIEVELTMQPITALSAHEVELTVVYNLLSNSFSDNYTLSLNVSDPPTEVLVLYKSHVCHVTL